MADKHLELIYQTGKVKLLHKRELCFLKTSIDETIKSLKNSYLGDKDVCIKLLDNVPKYHSHNFEEVLNEMRKVFIVGLYHMWERNLKELLIKGSGLHCLQLNKIDRFSINEIIKIFDNKNSSNELKETFDYLRKYSNLNNAIKHGPTSSQFKKLYKDYGEFFKLDELNNDEYFSNFAIEPIVTEEHINELYDNLMKFWDNVSDNLILNTKNLME